MRLPIFSRNDGRRSTNSTTRHACESVSPTAGKEQAQNGLAAAAWASVFLSNLVPAPPRPLRF